MTPSAALAHFAAKLPTNIDRQSPEEAVDREAVAALTASQHGLEQLRVDIAHAAGWLREPGVGGAEVFPWLLARAGLDVRDTE